MIYLGNSPSNQLGDLKAIQDDHLRVDVLIGVCRFLLETVSSATYFSKAAKRSCSIFKSLDDTTSGYDDYVKLIADQTDSNRVIWGTRR